MIEARAALPWILSGITLAQAVMTGNKWRSGWLVGLAGQALWAVWIIAAQTYGFAPLTVTLTVIYARNWWRWRPQ